MVKNVSDDNVIQKGIDTRNFFHIKIEIIYNFSCDRKQKIPMTDNIHMIKLCSL